MHTTLELICLQEQCCRVLNMRLEGRQPLCTDSTIDNSVITAERCREHHGFLVDLLTIGIVIGNDSVLNGTQRQSNRLRLPNNGRTGLDAIHTHVHDRYGTDGAKFVSSGHGGLALFRRLELCHGCLDVVRDGFHTPPTGIANYGTVQRIATANDKVHIHGIVHSHGSVHPASVGRGDGLHGGSGRLDHKVVDGNAGIVLTKIEHRIELLASFQKRIQRNVDCEVVMRYVLLGMRKLSGNLHGGRRERVVGVADTRHRRGGRRCHGGSSGRRGRSSGFGGTSSGGDVFPHIIGNNPPAGSSTDNVESREGPKAHLLGQSMRQRRCHDAITGGSSGRCSGGKRGCHRSSSSRSWRGSSSWCRRCSRLSRGGGSLHNIVLEGADIVALLDGDHDGLAAGNFGRAGIGENPGEEAIVLRLKVDGGLVGLDLAENIAGGKFFSLCQVPLGDCPGLHSRRKRRHSDELMGWVAGHPSSPRDARRSGDGGAPDAAGGEPERSEGGHR
mmetsp:Transcript_6256/g.17496  ORF Transcript_6256/g.17496 Transcript_6256/m.17496 type:complete len:501 (+) Transcript_6256:1943-3445(+)